MAGVGLLALLDDIATVLDDVAILTKVAAKKTAGVLGDDLALNAQQVSGVKAEREIPVVWAVAKGSAKNKMILVPLALGISIIAPWAITPLLMIGGAYLCFEGFEKIFHKLFHRADEEKEHEDLKGALLDPAIDLVEFENKKIKGAIRTDFILSAEIIVIALGTVQTADMSTQVAVVTGIAVIMTVGVYSLVAGIVKLDDAGLYLMKVEGGSLWERCKRAVGSAILAFCPYLMKSLSIIGTAAMFMVGGGILVHGMPVLHDSIHHTAESVGHHTEMIPAFGSIVTAVTPTLLNAFIGIVTGGLVLFGVWIAQSAIGVFRSK